MQYILKLRVMKFGHNMDMVDPKDDIDGQVKDQGHQAQKTLFQVSFDLVQMTLFS